MTSAINKTLRSHMALTTGATHIVTLGKNRSDSDLFAAGDKATAQKDPEANMLIEINAVFKG